MITVTSTSPDGAVYGDSESFASMDELREDLQHAADPEYAETVLSGLQNARSVTVPNGNLTDTYTIGG